MPNAEAHLQWQNNIFHSLRAKVCFIKKKIPEASKWNNIKILDRRKLHSVKTGAEQGVVCCGVALLFALSILLHYCAQFWYYQCCAHYLATWPSVSVRTPVQKADCAQRELDRTVGLPAELLHWASYTFMDLWWEAFYWGQRTRSRQKSNGFMAER